MGRSVKDSAERMRLLRLKWGFTWISCVLIQPAFDLYVRFQFLCVYNLAVDGDGRRKILHWFCSSPLAYDLARFLRCDYLSVGLLQAMCITRLAHKLSESIFLSGQL